MESEIVEKRARKAIGKLGIKRGDSVQVVNDGSCEGEANAYLAGKLLADAKVKISRKASGRAIKPYSAEDLAEMLLDSMLKGKAMKKPQTIIGDSTRKEIEAYARTKRIKYKARRNGRSSAQMLDRLEKKQPGSAQAMAKASRKLKWQR